MVCVPVNSIFKNIISLIYRCVIEKCNTVKWTLLYALLVPSEQIYHSFVVSFTIS